jgi:hypothetical protein
MRWNRWKRWHCRFQDRFWRGVRDGGQRLEHCQLRPLKRYFEVLPCAGFHWYPSAHPTHQVLYSCSAAFCLSPPMPSFRQPMRPYLSSYSLGPLLRILNDRATSWILVASQVASFLLAKSFWRLTKLEAQPSFSMMSLFFASSLLCWLSGHDRQNSRWSSLLQK